MLSRITGRTREAVSHDMPFAAARGYRRGLVSVLFPSSSHARDKNQRPHP